MRHRATLALGLLALAAGTASAAAEPWAPGQVLVKFESEGPHALRECAETLTIRERGLAAATADRSDSLDRLHERLRVRRVRALFRRPDGTSFAEQRRRLSRRFEAVRRRDRGPLPDLAHVYLVQIPDALDVPSAVAEYRADPHVVYAQPNFTVESQALEDGLPNDPFFATGGSWGQPYEDLWSLLQMRADAAWPLARGEGIVVAVNDSGLDHEHPDIAANVWVNPGEDRNGNGIAEDSDRNGLDDDGNGFIDDLRGFDFHNSIDIDENGQFDDPSDLSDPDPFDDNGHGTHVAGTVAAVGDNGIGVVGVAPRARIMALKGIGDTGSGSTADLARGIVYAAENGARIVNNSWSCSIACPSNPLAEEAVRLAHGLGVVLVFSAGNRADDVAFYSPQNMRETITVAATDPADEVASFSNRGLLLDVSAPGAGFLDPPPEISPRSGVLSLRSSEASPAIDGGGLRVVAGRYLRLAGTSMAAPHAAGLAALLLSAQPELTPDEVRRILRLTAQDLGRPGYDARSGAGRIDAERALTLQAVPRVRAVISSPRILETVRLRGGSFDVIGTVGGADFGEYQLFAGVGADPEVWTPLAPPRRQPVEDAVLGAWSLDGLEEGPHVIRLSVTARDGSVIEEFTPVGLERNPGRLLGSTGGFDRKPVVAGTQVVWETRHSVSGEDEGWNLFMADFVEPGGAPRPIVAGPGDAQEPSFSAGRLAWHRREQANPGSFTCLIDAEAGCDPVQIGSGIALFPKVSGNRIIWLGHVDGRTSIHFCEVDAETGDCPERDLAPGPGLLINPAIDGRRVVWSNVLEFVTCTLGPTGECAPLVLVPFGPDSGFVITPALSGDLNAWVDIRRDFSRQDIRICELHPTTGRCPVIEIPTSGNASSPAVSGNRVVWHDSAGLSNTEIFFCEYDREMGTCPVQRLTGSPHLQRFPAIDGNRVVWEDNRNGSFPDVFGFELPTLDAIGDRSAREGELLVVAVAGRDPLGDPVTLAARQPDGSPVEALGASFHDFGDGRGELRWQPDFDQAGSYALRIELTTAGLLRTGERIHLRVENVNRPPRIATRRLQVGTVGLPLVLDACDSSDPDGDPLAFDWRDDDGSPLGAECTLTLPARQRNGVFRVTLEVSDGQDTRSARVLALWRPAAAGG